MRIYTIQEAVECIVRGELAEDVIEELLQKNEGMLEDVGEWLNAPFKWFADLVIKNLDEVWKYLQAAEEKAREAGSPREAADILRHELGRILSQKEAKLKGARNNANNVVKDAASEMARRTESLMEGELSESFWSTVKEVISGLWNKTLKYGGWTISVILTKLKEFFWDYLATKVTPEVFKFLNLTNLGQMLVGIAIMGAGITALSYGLPVVLFTSFLGIGAAAAVIFFGLVMGGIIMFAMNTLELIYDGMKSDEPTWLEIGRYIIRGLGFGAGIATLGPGAIPFALVSQIGEK